MPRQGKEHVESVKAALKIADEQLAEIEAGAKASADGDRRNDHMLRVAAELRKNAELESMLAQARVDAAASTRHVVMWARLLAKMRIVCEEIEQPGIVPPIDDAKAEECLKAYLRKITKFVSVHCEP